MRRPFVMREGTDIYIKDDGTVLAGDGKNVEEFDDFAKAAYHLTLDGADEQAGSSTDGIGWAGLLRGVTVQYEDTNYLAEKVSIIVREDTRGFKEATMYQSAEAAELEWASLASSLEDDGEDDGDDDDDYEDEDDDLDFGDDDDEGE